MTTAQISLETPSIARCSPCFPQRKAQPLQSAWSSSLADMSDSSTSKARCTQSQSPAPTNLLLDSEEFEDDAMDTTTLASRFMTQQFKFLLLGIEAKDKNVRFRVVDFIAAMIEEIATIDDDVSQNLRAALIERLTDKEHVVRMRAVVSLVQFAAGEVSSKFKDKGDTVLEMLLQAMKTDPHPDVRSLIVDKMATELIDGANKGDIKPAIFARMRDNEAAVRKAVYRQVFEKGARDGNLFTVCPSSESQRLLEKADCALIVLNGLGDREPVVREAAASMISSWYDVISATNSDEELALKFEDVDISATQQQPVPSDGEKPAARSAAVMKNLTTFLSLFDLRQETDVNGEKQRGKAASDALQSLFSKRKDIERDVHFKDDFLANRTPETVFLIRAFAEHCSDGREQLLEDCGMPVATLCAFQIKSSITDFLDVDKLAVLPPDKRQDKQGELEFITGELLGLAASLDYSEGHGRKTMDRLIKGLLALKALLPISLATRCLDVLRKITSDERDFIRQVVELISDLRDEPDDGAGDRSLDSIDSSQGTPRRQPVRDKLSDEQQAIADEIDLRCLALTIALLRRLDGTFEENSTLQGLFNDLILPSVRSKNPELHSQGLVAFGLSILVTRHLAKTFLSPLLEQAKAKLPQETRSTLFKIVFDVLLAHTTLEHQITHGSHEFLLDAFENQCARREDYSPDILALLSLGLSKLVLYGLVEDPKLVLLGLCRAYFSPYNRDNQPLLQSFSYFLHVYSHSSSAQQEIVQQLFPAVFKETAEMYREYEENEATEEANLNIGNVVGLWTECTDPTQLIDGKDASVESLVHLALAEDTLRMMLSDTNMPKDHKKLLCQMLLKLNFPDEVDMDRVRSFYLLLKHMTMRRPPKDATANNALKKFMAKFEKQFANEIEGFDEADFRKMEQNERIRELFEFLDNIAPEDIEEEPKKKGRKRRSDSIMSTTDDDAVSVASSRQGKAKPKAKKRRLSTTDGEDSDSDDHNTIRGTPPPPRRMIPRRTAAVRKKPQQVIVISDDEESEHDDGDDEPDERSRRSVARRWPTNNKRKEEAEARLDAQMNILLDDTEPSSVGHDSIMDDSDEDANEVNNLLAEDDE
ncbi:Peptidase A1 domain-containing protein [Mycena chlorophos]|uniref:Peptidase A1 domain-containing protein n=1 Tax=Mycena chlorophos TaxID=658473 RepID=A0A8H6THY8_MYCCL|nr:Peptidase A1 domain-containing protein [Mycena chlorophos]